MTFLFSVQMAQPLTANKIQCQKLQASIFPSAVLANTD
jgi:hypothetical protein